MPGLHRRSRRRVAALGAMAATALIVLRPVPGIAAAYQYFQLTFGACEHVTEQTNVGLGGPSDWQPVWTCATTASTNTNLAGTAAGSLTIYVSDYANTLPCSPTANVDMTVVYADSFGTMTWGAPAMPYAVLPGTAPQCETNYPLNGRITPSGVGAYSGMDEVCIFHAIGTNDSGSGGGTGLATVNFSTDNQKTTSPCTLSN